MGDLWETVFGSSYHFTRTILLTVSNSTILIPSLSSQIIGTDFGALSLVEIPEVFVGGVPCGLVNRQSNTEVVCNVAPSGVGRDDVIVSLSGLNSSQSVFVDRMCGAGYTAIPGDRCAPCPNVSVLCCAVLRAGARVCVCV